MAQDKDTLKKINEILALRAQRLAHREQDQLDRHVAAVVVEVRLGEERIGLPVSGLKEIAAVPPITPLPGLPQWIPGISQMRGELFTVVDAAGWFGVTGKSTESNLAVLAGAEGLLGLIVGEVLGFREIYNDEISEKKERSGEDRPVSAITSDMVSIVDLKALWRDPRIMIRQGAKV